MTVKTSSGLRTVGLFFNRTTGLILVSLWKIIKKLHLCVTLGFILQVLYYSHVAAVLPAITISTLNIIHTLYPCNTTPSVWIWEHKIPPLMLLWVFGGGNTEIGEGEGEAGERRGSGDGGNGSGRRTRGGHEEYMSRGGRV